MSRPLIVLGASLLLALGACGSSGSTTATGSPSPEPAPDSATSSPSAGETLEPSATPSRTTRPAPTGPPCSQVWSAGARIPEGYDGCLQGDRFVEAQTRRCASGQVIVTFADRYYGAKGYPVNDVGSPLSASAQYRSATRSCG